MQAKNSCGVEIEEVEKGSTAEKAGLLVNDKIISLNSHKVRDVIDLMYYSNEATLKVVVKRSREKKLIQVKRGEEHAPLGLLLKPFKVKTCRNNCLFCFVAQLPKGMRRSLYIKDEDYRMSFLYGNYVTLANITDAERKRIVEQKLSPLYISVHSTDVDLRNKLIGNPRAGNILKHLKFFAEHRIKMHTQIVLCPGYNDGEQLVKTIADLYKFYPYISSIAVVPVGLTAHRKKALNPVEKQDAIRAIETIHRFQQRFKRKHGEHIVFAADELYIKAGLPLPPLKEYGDLAQLENGVGLVAQFLHQAKKVKIPHAPSHKKRFFTITGVSFAPFLTKFVERLKKSGFEIEVIPVKNAFFGHSITVTGLITGRDVIRALSGVVAKGDVLLIPDIAMREGNEVFLDDVSRRDLEEVLGVETRVVESTPEGLVRAVSQPQAD